MRPLVWCSEDGAFSSSPAPLASNPLRGSRVSWTAVFAILHGPQELGSTVSDARRRVEVTAPVSFKRES
jgi:hypothetical protein